MSFKSYYNASPPEPPDLHEIFCVDCECCTIDGECELGRIPEDCAAEMTEYAESCRDAEIDRRIDEERMKEEEKS